jgi:hypothetical protein
MSTRYNTKSLLLNTAEDDDHNVIQVAGEIKTMISIWLLSGLNSSRMILPFISLKNINKK